MSESQLDNGRTLSTPSCQGLALASTSLDGQLQSREEKLVDPKAKPWDDYRDGGKNGARVGRAIHTFCALALMLAVATALVACGKKGDPTLPEGKKDDYPHTYPQSSDPQTGVFSG
jgi:predicted small lipoprotein YifL